MATAAPRTAPPAPARQGPLDLRFRPDFAALAIAGNGKEDQKAQKEAEQQEASIEIVVTPMQFETSQAPMHPNVSIEYSAEMWKRRKSALTLGLSTEVGAGIASRGATGIDALTLDAEMKLGYSFKPVKGQELSFDVGPLGGWSFGAHDLSNSLSVGTKAQYSLDILDKSKISFFVSTEGIVVASPNVQRAIEAKTGVEVELSSTDRMALVLALEGGVQRALKTGLVGGISLGFRFGPFKTRR